MKKKPDIIEALKHPRIFRPLLGDLSTWHSWIVWLKAVFGLPMDEGELELCRKCTGRNLGGTNRVPPNFKESYAIVGRRGGKSRIVSFAAVFIACFYDFKNTLPPAKSAWS
jgi:hypothetical protein